MNKGKSIELLLKVIQEALKDSPSTKIHHDCHLPNIDGVRRQIDILIEGRINDFEILIAIECKDLKRPVPAKEIEAFYGKCDRIPKINKRVFVSTSGYQREAINAAKTYNISLFDLKSISVDTVKEWFLIGQLNQKFQLDTPLSIGLTGPTRELKFSEDEDLLVHFRDDKDSKKASQFVIEAITPGLKELRSYLLIELMKSEMKNITDVVRTVPFEIKPTNVYVIDENNNEFTIDKISASITTWMEVTQAKIIGGTVYAESSNEPRAQVVTIGLNDNQNAQFVLTKESELNVFLTDNKSNVKKMEVLASYDPKTQELKIGPK